MEYRRMHYLDIMQWLRSVRHHNAMPTEHSHEVAIKAAVESIRFRTRLAWKEGIEPRKALMP